MARSRSYCATSTRAASSIDRVSAEPGPTESQACQKHHIGHWPCKSPTRFSGLTRALRLAHALAPDGRQPYGIHLIQDLVC